MRLTQRDQHRTSQTRHGHWRVRRRRRVIPELTRTVQTPTLHSPTREQRTRMRLTQRDTGGSDEPGEACNADRGSRGDGRSVAELTVRVVAPALDGAVAEQRAGVAVSGGHCHRVRHTSHGDRADRIERRAVAQLTVDVVSPTLHAAVGQQRAAPVAVPGSHRHRVGNSGHADGRQRRGSGPVAELTVAVVAPTLHPAGLEHCARVTVTTRN